MNSNYKPEYYDNLELTLDYIMTECSVATKHRRHELRQIYLSTFGELYPEVRTVILRRQNLRLGSLFFHTDERSQKFSQIKKNPHACLLGYNHQRQYQLRMKGQIELHHIDSVARSDWNNLGSSSRRSYQTKFKPGEFCTLPSNEFEQSEDSDFGFDRFVVGHFKVIEIEWLHLNPEGHRRALFTFDQNLAWSSQWLQP